MLPPCCYCGLPLDKISQYLGIADVLLGLLNFIIMAIHVNEVYTEPKVDLSIYHYKTDTASFSYRYRTFPKLNFLPPGLAICITVCFGVQFLMGIVLYISASNRNRKACIFWLVVTASTCLLSNHFIIRIWEMLVVNEFVYQLKEEQEVTYFPGQQQQQQYPHNPIQIQLQHYHHHHQPQHQGTIEHQPQSMGNLLVPSADSRIGLITIPTITPAPYSINTVPEVYSPGNGYYGGVQYAAQSGGGMIVPPNQYPHNIPPALQPPPQYDMVVNNDKVNNAGESSSMNGGTSNHSTATDHTIQSVMFPNSKNNYDNAFSRF